jgi:pterin-4a-carbinolamine dehydratase
LKRRVDNGIKLTEKEARDWRLMKNSKYVNYSFNNYRDIINTMNDPGAIAELMT